MTCLWLNNDSANRTMQSSTCSHQHYSVFTISWQLEFPWNVAWHFQWDTSHWILRWIFNGSWQRTTAVITCPFRTFDVICGIKARPHGWWTKTATPHLMDMPKGYWPTARDIPMPYPPHGILRFCPSAMCSCYIICQAKNTASISWWTLDGLLEEPSTK